MGVAIEEVVAGPGIVDDAVVVETLGALDILAVIAVVITAGVVGASWASSASG